MFRRVFLALSIAALSALTISTATATAAPQLGLGESAPATVLYGTPATVTLTAANTASSGTIINTASVTTNTGLVTPGGTTASASSPVDPPIDNLAFTGFNVLLVGGLGLGLTILGAGITAFRRRREA